VTGEVAGLAVEYLAEGGEGGEADGAGATVLEHREVGDGDPDPVGELGEGRAALIQQPVQGDYPSASRSASSAPSSRPAACADR
jgi:hypothetical protein